MKQRMEAGVAHFEALPAEQLQQELRWIEKTIRKLQRQRTAALRAGRNQRHQARAEAIAP